MKQFGMKVFKFTDTKTNQCVPFCEGLFPVWDYLLQFTYSVTNHLCCCMKCLFNNIPLIWLTCYQCKSQDGCLTVGSHARQNTKISYLPLSWLVFSINMFYIHNSPESSCGYTLFSFPWNLQHKKTIIVLCLQYTVANKSIYCRGTCLSQSYWDQDSC